MWHHLPNAISSARILIVIPLVHSLWQQRFELALWLFLIAGLSDALDGFLARAFHWHSYLGAILDPLADKLLLVSSYISLAYLQVIPWWLTLLVLGRDLIIVIGALIYRWRYHHLDIQPSLISKLNTLLQILLVLCLIYALAFSVDMSHWQYPLILAVSLSTLASGLDYIIRWSLKAWREH